MPATVSGPNRPRVAPPLWSVSMEDWTIMREIVAAVRRPDAAGAPPGVVLEHVLSALRQADAKLVVPSNCPETNGRSYRRPDSIHWVWPVQWPSPTIVNRTVALEADIA